MLGVEASEGGEGLLADRVGVLELSPALVGELSGTVEAGGAGEDLDAAREHGGGDLVNLAEQLLGALEDGVVGCCRGEQVA